MVVIRLRQPRPSPVGADGVQGESDLMRNKGLPRFLYRIPLPIGFHNESPLLARSRGRRPDPARGESKSNVDRRPKREADPLVRRVNVVCNSPRAAVRGVLALPKERG